GRRHSASYVVEVQELVDRMFRTIASRAGRAIAGSSMGGFGAMHVALANPERFAVVESWLGFFDVLSPELQADALVSPRIGLTGHRIRRRGLRVFGAPRVLRHAQAWVRHRGLGGQRLEHHVCLARVVRHGRARARPEELRVAGDLSAERAGERFTGVRYPAFA